MNPEIKTKWIAALRSGKYKQGKRFLNLGDHYCCLGVLWDIEVGEWGQPHPSGIRYAVRDGTPACSQLPVSFAMRIGLTDAEQDTLIIMNDGIGGSNVHTFPQIADYIEENL